MVHLDSHAFELSSTWPCETVDKNFGNETSDIYELVDRLKLSNLSA